MASKSTSTGLNTGVELPSKQLELIEGFEDTLAGRTAPSEAPEAPESTPLPEEPIAPVTEAPAAPVPEADVSTVAETAGLVEEEVAEDQPQKFGPPDPKTLGSVMTQRARGTQPQKGTYWEYNADPVDPDAPASSDAMPNGDIEGRAARLAEDLTNGSVYIGATTAAAAETSPVKSVLNKTSALDQGQAANNPNTPRITPMFAKVMTYIVEDALSQTAFGKNEEGQFDPMDNVTDDQLMGTGAFSKADGNRRLGKEIHRQHQRIINEQQQRPTDAYTDLTPDEEFLLGDMAKELYYQAMNKQYGENVILKRSDGSTNVQGEPVMFEVTDTGKSLFRKGNTLRKKLLPKDHVRPLKTPPVSGMLTGEIGRLTKRVTQKVFVPGPGTAVGSRELNEAMRNLSQVAHVVDPQRLKILLATALPALSQNRQGNPVYRSINHIGDDKMNEFIARQKIAESQNRRVVPNPLDSMAAIENDLAQALYGICLDRDGANYLTYYLQGATGRIAVQQTNFDPTTKKSVRFVTRSATPTRINKGSRFDKALRQMYAMALVKDADAMVPSAREQALLAAEGSLYNKGVRLREALAAISDSQVEKVADAIAAGVPMSDPNFPQMPELQLDPNNESDANLMAEIQKKGEDGQAYIDGLIDFANYKEAMDSGQQYQTYFNAYIDGKTNGLAGNGMQLGDETVATRTGVLRDTVGRGGGVGPPSPFFLDGNQDIRDVLENTLIKLSKESEYEEFPRDDWPEVYQIAEIVYANRGLNKTTSMTFGYGKNAEGFKQDIEEFMLIMQGQGTPESQRLNELMSIFESTGSSRSDLIDAIHSHYDQALRHVLGDETMQSRNLMRGAAFLHSIANSLFTIESPTGYPLNMGGMMTTGATKNEATPIKIFVNQRPEDVNESYRKKTAPKSQVYGEEATSAAPKIRTDVVTGEQTTEVGGTSWGSAIPIPVQSIDAATVARVASDKGGRWADIKKRTQDPKNQPYVFPIYDAFKMDAASYDAVLENVNKAWVDINFQWSYLKQTKTALKKLRQSLDERFKDPDQVLMGNERAMLDYLFSTYTTSNQKQILNITNKLGQVMYPPPKSEEIFDVVNSLQKDMVRNDFTKFSRVGKNDVIDPDTELTVGDLKIFMNALERKMKIDTKLESFIKEVESRKSALKSKIMANINSNDPDLAVLQYYSH